MGKQDFICENQDKKVFLSEFGLFCCCCFVAVVVSPKHPFFPLLKTENYCWLSYLLMDSEFIVSGVEVAQKEISSYKDLPRFWIFLVFYLEKLSAIKDTQIWVSLFQRSVSCGLDLLGFCTLSYFRYDIVQSYIFKNGLCTGC